MFENKPSKEEIENRLFNMLQRFIFDVEEILELEEGKTLCIDNSVADLSKDLAELIWQSANGN